MSCLMMEKFMMILNSNQRNTPLCWCRRWMRKYLYQHMRWSHMLRLVLLGCCMGSVILNQEYRRLKRKHQRQQQVTSGLKRNIKCIPNFFMLNCTLLLLHINGMLMGPYKESLARLQLGDQLQIIEHTSLHASWKVDNFQHQTLLGESLKN